ncbi:NitT/TauT family transport system substrate-binding protein [Bradyrhizobium sp. GM5.1]
MIQPIDRRAVLRQGAVGIGLAALGSPHLALAQVPRILKINTLASAAFVNVPVQAAVRSLLGQQPGFANAEVRPTAKIPQIIQEVIAGTADLGDADIASTLAAAEAGADLKIIGLSYSNTSQVIVTNADKTKSLEALAAAGGTVAVNAVGDFMYVMLIGVLQKRGIDPKKVNFIEMGSSGDRARALLAGRVDAVPMHIEQAVQLRERGDFQILVRPWQEYDNWFSIVLATTGEWLRKDENKKAAVAVLKSVLTAFRKTDDDYAWFKAAVGEYASTKALKSAGDDLVKPVWTTLRTEVKAFPRSMETLTPDAFAQLIPFYKAAGALKGTPDLTALIDRTYLDLALKELG